MGRRRQRVHRRDGEPVVLRGRPRPAGDRRRGREPDRDARGLLVLRSVHQRTGRPARREARDVDRDARRPGLLLRVGFGSRRHGDEARPSRPRHGRSPGAHADHLPRPRLSRHQLRRHERAGHRAEPGGLGPARRRRVAGPGRRRRGALGADDRTWQRGRGRAHRTGAGCRRRVPAVRGLPRRRPPAVRSTRRAARSSTR